MSYNKRIKRAEDVAQELSHVAVSHDNEDTSSRGAFADFVAENAKSEELLTRMQDAERVEVMQGVIASLDREKATADFALKLQKHAKNIKRKRNILLVACSAVAAAILIISFNIYNNTEVDYVNQVIAIENVAKPTLFIDNKLTIEVGSELNMGDYVTTHQEAKKIKKETTNVHINRLVVPKGYTVTVELPDGSMAHVNALSELRYPSSFDTVREVELSGEAFFEVKTDSTKQFRVTTKQNVSVNVYGTKFNVNTRRDSLVRALLVKGAIGVSLPNGEEVKVKESHILSYDLNSESYELEEIIVYNFLGYLTNAFKYERGSIYDLVSDLETWYDIKINNAEILSSAAISFDVSRTIELFELLDFLENMLEVKFIREGEKEYSIEQMN